jgi:hypothetical protein
MAVFWRVCSSIPRHTKAHSIRRTIGTWWDRQKWCLPLSSTHNRLITTMVDSGDTRNTTVLQGAVGGGSGEDVGAIGQ